MVDRARIFIKAGDGGAGSASFRREKFIPRGGPDGGDGGKGGNVYFVTEANISTLADFARQERFEAENGGPGIKKKMFGKAGKDLIIKVPVGTIVKLRLPTAKMTEIEKIIDFDKKDMNVKVAKGGKGGRGNVHFKSSRNTTPREFEVGVPGEAFAVEMELKLLADIALVGLPNAGKSTLLSVLSAAKPKIADYPFTTLEPNLGVLNLGEKNVVIADIPGLIEGASEGKGLGIQFLQHVERTRILLHLVSLESADPIGDYKSIRKEMELFGQGLKDKKELVLLTKADLFDEERAKEVKKMFAKKKIRTLIVSSGNRKGIDELKKEIQEII